MRTKSIKNKFIIFFICSVLSILAVGLSGCDGIENDIIDDVLGSDKQTVFIKVNQTIAMSLDFKIYMDGEYVGNTDYQGELTIENVPNGIHEFEAFDSIWNRFYGFKEQEIKELYNTGSNSVYIDADTDLQTETTGNVSVMILGATQVYFDISVDGVYKGTTKFSLDIGEVSVGEHTFKAIETNPLGSPRVGETVQTIAPGNQWVGIYVDEIILKEY